MIDMGQPEYAREFGSESPITDNGSGKYSSASPNAMSIREGKSNMSPMLSPRSSMMSIKSKNS